MCQSILFKCHFTSFKCLFINFMCRFRFTGHFPIFLSKSSRGRISKLIFAPLTTPYVRISYTAFQFILQCVLLSSGLKQKVVPFALVFCLRLLFEQLSIIRYICNLFGKTLILSLPLLVFLVELAI